MAQLDSLGNITIEIGTQRLPARMVIGRLAADLRYPGDLLPSRRPRVSRLTIAMLAALLVPLASAAHSRHASVAR